jgi:hypothetical protein
LKIVKSAKKSASPYKNRGSTTRKNEEIPQVDSEDDYSEEGDVPEGFFLAESNPLLPNELVEL